MARVGIDIDGVIYKFEDALRDYLRSKGETRYLPDAQQWNFYEQWGMSRTDFNFICNKAVDDGHLFWKGEAYDGAQEAIQRLLDAGHEVILITARNYGKPGNTALATTDWLRDNDIEYHELHTDVRDKTSIPVDYYIDDKWENFEAVRDTPKTLAFLMDRPWNKDHWTNYRVKDLNEFVDNVLADQIDQTNYELDQGNPYAEEVRITSSTGGQKGQKMARIGSIDPQAILRMAQVAGFGEQKYERLNYLNGYDWSLSYDACQRHLMAFWSGEDLDPESGLPHLAHAGWHCMAMLAFMERELGTDNRFKQEL